MNREMESTVLDGHAAIEYDWRKPLIREEGQVWEDAFYHRISNPRLIDTRFIETHPKTAARPGEYSWIAARVPPGCQVIDIGTGPSDFPFKLADFFGCSVICVDPDLREFPEHSRVLPLRVPFENWDVAPNSVECVTLVSVLEHVKPVEDGDIKVMQNVHRCLKPGGICLMTMPFTGTTQGGVDPRYDGISSLQRYYSLEDIHLRLVAPSDFILIETDYLWTSKDATHYCWATVPKATVICVALRKRCVNANETTIESSSVISRNHLDLLIG